MSRQIATLLRRYPGLMRLPYFLYSRTQPRYTVGVVAVVFNHQGETLLVEHAYHPRFAWGLPGGWVDADEDPADAVLRELREELSLKAEVCGIAHVAKTGRNHIDIACLCTAQGKVGKLSHELLGYRWVSVDSLPALRRFHAQAIARALGDKENGLCPGD